MFRSPKHHPRGVCQALLQLPLCTINMYDYVGDVGARLDVLPEDGPLGTETCRSFIGILAF